MDDNDLKLWQSIAAKSDQKFVLKDKTIETKYFGGRPLLGKIVILPEREAIKFIYDKPWACISITEEHDAAIREENRVDLLRLKFDDIDYPNESSFTDDHAILIDQFVGDVWSKVDILVIHCYAGISRSSAVGMVVSEIYQPEFCNIFPALYSPNRLVAKILREMMNVDNKINGSE